MKPEVVRVEAIWRQTYRVTFRLKGPRHYIDLFRKIDDDWFTGEANPTGCCSGPLRQACPEIASALNLASQ